MASKQYVCSGCATVYRVVGEQPRPAQVERGQPYKPGDTAMGHGLCPSCVAERAAAADAKARATVKVRSGGRA